MFFFQKAGKLDQAVGKATVHTMLHPAGEVVGPGGFHCQDFLHEAFQRLMPVLQLVGNAQSFFGKLNTLL